jgi:hypothetical protein
MLLLDAFMNCPQPTLFKANSPRVALLSLGDRGDVRQRHLYTFGVHAVIDELPVNVTKIVTPRSINDADIVILSLCSLRDAMSFLLSVKTRPASRLIIGGHGVYSFLPFRHLCHRIAFGRAEDAVADCVLGESPLAWCYDYDRDPHATGRYEIRQARRILPGEWSVGCNGACAFCQYRATRRLFGKRYGGRIRAQNPGECTPVESRWEDLTPTTVQQTTGLDGWSETTRRRVRKPISDNAVVDYIERALRTVRGKMILRTYMIVGYPWETPESVMDDIGNFGRLLSRVKPGFPGSRVILHVRCTPFIPHAMTAMENCACNVDADWPKILSRVSRIHESPHVAAYMHRGVLSPLRLYQECAMTRIADPEKLRTVVAAQTLEDAMRVGGDIHRAGQGCRVSGILRMESDASNRGICLT